MSAGWLVKPSGLLALAPQELRPLELAELASECSCATTTKTTTTTTTRKSRQHGRAMTSSFRRHPSRQINYSQARAAALTEQSNGAAPAGRPPSMMNGVARSPLDAEQRPASGERKPVARCWRSALARARGRSSARRPCCVVILACVKFA